ncbi:MAG: P44/Msp2 family outer membrane protein [Anaplasma sp.]
MARVMYGVVVVGALCLLSTTVQSSAAPRIPHFYASLTLGPTVGHVGKFKLDDYGGEVRGVVPYAGCNRKEIVSGSFDWFKIQDTPGVQWKNYGFTGLQATLGHHVRNGVRVEVELTHERHYTLGRDEDGKVAAGGSKYFALVGDTAAMVRDPVYLESALRSDGALSEIETLDQLRRYLREHVARGVHGQQEERAVRYTPPGIAAEVAHKLEVLIREKRHAASLAKASAVEQVVVRLGTSAVGLGMATAGVAVGIFGSVLGGLLGTPVATPLRDTAQRLIRAAATPPHEDAAIRDLRDMEEQGKVMLSRAVAVILEGGAVIVMAPAIKKTVAMVNVCYDFHRWWFHQWGMYPFVCGGIGGALMNWSGNSVNKLNYGIKGGLSYRFYRNVTGLVSVSYGGTAGWERTPRLTMPVLHMLDGTTTRGDRTAPPGKTKGQLKTSMGLSTLGVGVGIRVGF